MIVVAPHVQYSVTVHTCTVAVHMYIYVVVVSTGADLERGANRSSGSLKQGGLGPVPPEAIG